MLRLAPLVAPESIWVCTTAELAEAVRRELPEVPPAQVLCEPEGRNTAAAIGWSVRSMPEPVRRGLVAVLPADHRVGDPAAFRAALARAARAAEGDLRAPDRPGAGGEADPGGSGSPEPGASGALGGVGEPPVVTLGVVPRWAETGYGYLEVEPEAGEEGLRRVRRFVEKPDAATAAGYLASGRHFWNAGIFVFRGTTLLELLARWQPELARGLERIAADPASQAEIYARLPAESIDYALMEKLQGLAMVPLDCGWSDLGSWAALAEVLPAGDELGNRGRGDTLAVDAGGNLLFSDRGTIAVLGVEGLVVVRTEDAVLVVPRERSQEVRRLIAALAERGRQDLL
jgi:mannose-1-phosphate guanylyltransferase